MPTLARPVTGSAESPPHPVHPRRAAIRGVGRCVPADILDNAQLERLVETSDAWILERTGIRERHRVGSGETAASLGAAAARSALERAGNLAIDAIICATCTPDTLVPPTACLIQRRLGLPGNAAAFDVNAACSGYLYALITAKSLIESRAATNVLVVAAEAMTSLVDYRDRTTCVLFGDGAAATVVGAVEGDGMVATTWGADGKESDLVYYGSTVETDQQGIRMAGRGTFRLAVERLCGVAGTLCAEADWSTDDIDLFIPHQANKRIIEAAAKRLGIGMDRVMCNIDRVGNTSAASIPLALADAVDAGRLGPGARVVMAAFGAGATWGGVAMRWNVGSPVQEA